MKIANLGTKADTEKLIKKLIPDNQIRKEILEFLSGLIHRSIQQNNSNWNVNLDKNGKFLRFHVGSLMAMEVTKKKVLVACIRTLLEKMNEENKLDCSYKGYLGKKAIENRNIEKIPGYCTTIPDSIGVTLDLSSKPVHVTILQDPACEFVDQAQNTIIVRKLKRVHSTGAIEFLNEEVHLQLRNPDYIKDDISEK